MQKCFYLYKEASKFIKVFDTRKEALLWFQDNILADYLIEHQNECDELGDLDMAEVIQFLGYTLNVYYIESSQSVNDQEYLKNQIKTHIEKNIRIKNNLNEANQYIRKVYSLLGKV